MNTNIFSSCTLKNSLRSLLFAGALTGVVGVAPSFACDHHVVVENDSDSAITNLYISPSGDSSWHRDVLGRGVLLPGEAVRINVDDGSHTRRWDFRAVTDDDRSTSRYGLDTCETESWTIE